MAIKIKEKYVYSYKNFLGLDKTNKLLKVAKERATNGKNFIIDSKTLKTRPAFRFKNQTGIDFDISENAKDFIVDWHIFDNIKVYVTKEHIYIEDKNFIFNDKTQNDKVVLSYFPTMNNENLLPLFQEEKDCLFIFCLNNIYVFSIIRDSNNTILKYVLYDLKAKPANPFVIVDSESYIQYENLPTPYEPTLFIGDSRFDDVNLLSNISKYKVFASSKTVENNEILYKLPTHYDKNKNGSFTYDVKFYNDRFEDMEIFPVFLGRPKENFPDVTLETEIEENYGQFIGEEYQIKETFFSNKEFEILIDENDNEVIIKNEIGLTKEEFFNFRETTTNIPVFEFLFNFIKNNTKEPENLYLKFAENMIDYEIVYINGTTVEIYISTPSLFTNLTDDDMIVFKKTNGEYISFVITNFEATSREKFTITNPNGFGDIDVTDMYLFTYDGDYIDDNRVVKFSLKYNVKAIVRDKETNYIVNSKTIANSTTIYIQLKKYETSYFGLEEERVIISEPYITNSEDDYYPNVGFVADKSYYLTEAPITVLNSDSYANRAKIFIINNRSNPLYVFNDGEIVGIVAEVFKNVQNTSVETINITANTNQWHFAFNEYHTSDSDKVFPNYPIFENPYPSGYVVEGGVIHTSEKNPNWLGTAIQNELKNNISNILEEYKDSSSILIESKHGAFLKINVLSLYGTNAQNMYERYWSIVIPFYYEKKIYGTYEERRTYVYLAKIIRDRDISLKMYDFNYNEFENAFELRVKDYFIDYNNEPSIDVKVTFESNPDYDIIAKTKFGITFGSENRLFLAGNKDYKNIDRYNVSNDLLGNNVKNQSYELTYFPSKNYRVVGGNGAINGYVIATDSQLYVTKENHMGDNKLFIRERILDENGVVGYREDKTNISKTPLNNRTILRFFNDILMLTNDGLYAIEITNNVLTNERLIKLRSGFVNKDLVEKIKSYDKDKIYIVDNNEYMYIFIGNVIYTLDCKYISQIENNAIENVAYEMLEWEVPENHRNAKYINNELILLSEDGRKFYNIVDYDIDDIIENAEVNILNLPDTNYRVFMTDSATDNKIKDKKIASFIFKDLYESFAKKAQSDYDIDMIDQYSFYVLIENYSKFANIKNDDEIIFKTASAEYYKFKVEEYDGSKFIIRSEAEVVPSGLILNEIYINKYRDKNMYIAFAFDYKLDENYYQLYLLAENRFDEYQRITKDESETDAEYLARLNEEIVFFETVAYIMPESIQKVLLNFPEKIELVWYSNISDFGNNLMEKTMFKYNVYVTKQLQDNALFIGHKTMRRLRSIEDTERVLIAKSVLVANAFDFENFTFNNIGFNTIDESGCSIPIKENNFLYIQFVIHALGSVEINQIDFIYKNNRVIKTIG